MRANSTTLAFQRWLVGLALLLLALPIFQAAYVAYLDLIAGERSLITRLMWDGVTPHALYVIPIVVFAALYIRDPVRRKREFWLMPTLMLAMALDSVLVVLGTKAPRTYGFPLAYLLGAIVLYLFRPNSDEVSANPQIEAPSRSSGGKTIS